MSAEVGISRPRAITPAGARRVDGKRKVSTSPYSQAVRDAGMTRREVAALMDCPWFTFRHWMLSPDAKEFRHPGPEWFARFCEVMKLNPHDFADRVEDECKGRMPYKGHFASDVPPSVTPEPAPTNG